MIFKIIASVLIIWSVIFVIIGTVFCNSKWFEYASLISGLALIIIFGIGIYTGAIPIS